MRDTNISWRAAAFHRRSEDMMALQNAARKNVCSERNHHLQTQVRTEMQNFWCHYLFHPSYKWYPAQSVLNMGDTLDFELYEVSAAVQAILSLNMWPVEKRSLYCKLMCQNKRKSHLNQCQNIKPWQTVLSKNSLEFGRDHLRPSHTFLCCFLILQEAFQVSHNQVPEGT